MSSYVLSIGLLFAFAACASRPTTTDANAVRLEVREGFQLINGTRLFVRDVGPIEAPVLITVHGGPGGNHLSQRPLESLAPEYRVVSYDQRGTGDSDRFEISPDEPGSLTALSLEKNIEDLEQLRSFLGKDKITLIGHSYGGALATFYAASHPDHIEKLIVYSGGPEDKELAAEKSKKHFARLGDLEKQEFKSKIKLLKERVESGAAQTELDELFLGMVSVMLPALNCRPQATPHNLGRGGFWANQVVGQYSESFDRKEFASKLRNIQAPTLLIWGRCEPAPLERLLYLLDSLPNARLAVFENSGHNAMNEEPEPFFETLRSFLKDQPPKMKLYRTRKEAVQSRKRSH